MFGLSYTVTEPTYSDTEVKFDMILSGVPAFQKTCLPELGILVALVSSLSMSSQ